MKAIEKSDGISKVMNLINFDISKFRMSLDEYARLSALNRVMFIDKIEKLNLKLEVNAFNYLETFLSFIISIILYFSSFS